MSPSFAATTTELVALLGPSAVAAAPRDTSDAGIDVTLLGLVPCAPVRYTERQRRPVLLEYLISAAGPQTAAADELQRAWQTLSDAGHVEVATERVAPEWWLAFGVAPRPAVLVRCTVPIEDALHRAPPAERHIVRHHSDADTEAALAWTTDDHPGARS